MLRNLVDKIKSFFLLAPQVQTTDLTTAAADLQGVMNFAWMVSVGAAAFTGTDKMAIKITHSDDDVTYVNATSDDMYENVSANIVKELTAAGDASKIHTVEYRGNKRYVKLTLDIQGALTNVPVSVMGLSTVKEIM